MDKIIDRPLSPGLMQAVQSLIDRGAQCKLTEPEALDVCGAYQERVRLWVRIDGICQEAHVWRAGSIADDAPIKCGLCYPERPWSVGSVDIEWLQEHISPWNPRGISCAGW